MMKRITLSLNIILMIIIMGIGDSHAQMDPDSLYNSIVNAMNEKFENFKQESERVFNEFVEKNDQAFSNLLKNAWKDFDLEEGLKRKSDPKPVKPPKIESMAVANNEPDQIPVKAPEKKLYATRTKMPMMQKKEQSGFPTNNLQVNFYGADVNIDYDKNFLRSVPGTINNTVISSFWDNMVKTNHYTFINQLQSLKSNMNLNDWGYFLLVRAISDKIAPSSTNASKLLSWFILTKSQYKLKVGYNTNSVYLLISTKNMMYGKPYYTFGNERYYILEPNIGRIRTYSGSYPDAKLVFDFDVSQPLNIGQHTDKRFIKVTIEGKEHEIPVDYNTDNIKFYNDYPLVDLKIYFDAAGSPFVKESLMEYLKPLIKDKNEFDAVTLLLKFVQYGFSYKTDDDQFGKEKFFFPDDMFYYPFSDCEDRSVLFAYLVKELLEIEVVGLEYPGHMATAVRFNKDYQTDYFMYKGKKFTVCDPTYMGASVGMCMPQFLSVQGKIIELSNKKVEYAEKEEVWNKTKKESQTIYKSGTEEDIVFDREGNSYITGFFTGQAKIGDFILQAPNENNEFFIAKYNANKKLVWVRFSQGKGNNAGTSIAIDKFGDVIATGTYDKEIQFGNEILPSNGVMDIFVVKFSKEGKYLWSNKLAINANQIRDDLIFVSYFTVEGEHQTTLAFDKTEGFNNFGIKTDTDGNIFVTSSYTESGTLALSEDIKVESSAAFSHEAVWKAEYDRLLTNNYDKAIAGLFAFMRTMKVNGNSVSGKTVQEALAKYNPNFRKSSSVIYNNIGKISVIKNNGGIITLNTMNRQPVDFAELRIQDNTKLKINTYKGGNAQINFLSGASVGKAFVRFDLNFVKMLKDSGDLIFDFDVDHSQKKVNLKHDILD